MYRLFFYQNLYILLETGLREGLFHIRINSDREALTALRAAIYNGVVMLLTTFDFDDTRLSSPSRQQLNNIKKALKSNSRAVESRSKLLRLIEGHAYDAAGGLYIPVGKHVEGDGKKLPMHSQRVVPTNLPTEPFAFPYFTNALSIPDGWNTPCFDRHLAPGPTYRATNGGFLIVTIEHDCRTTHQFEEVLSWTRGGDGEFRHSPFAKVDRELTRHREYRGYSIVFSGNKSVHFHFVFDTRHLTNAPWDCSAEKRLTIPQSAIMNEAHRIYWDTTAEIFDEQLQPSLSPDKSLQSIYQWRRSPWALRELGKDLTVLGLAQGTIIPQLVIHEFVRSRSGRNCGGTLGTSGFGGFNIHGETAQQANTINNRGSSEASQQTRAAL